MFPKVVYHDTDSLPPAPLIIGKKIFVGWFDDTDLEDQVNRILTRTKKVYLGTRRYEELQRRKPTPTQQFIRRLANWYGSLNPTQQQIVRDRVVGRPGQYSLPYKEYKPTPVEKIVAKVAESQRRFQEWERQKLESATPEEAAVYHLNKATRRLLSLRFVPNIPLY